MLENLMIEYGLKVGPVTLENGADSWDCFVYKNIFEDDGSECYAVGCTPLAAALACVELIKHRRVALATYNTAKHTEK